MNYFEDFAWIVFIALLFCTPIILLIADTLILRKTLKSKMQQLSLKLALKVCFIQHLVSWIVVTLTAQIVYGVFIFDGLSTLQSFILLTLGILIYIIIGFYILKYFVGENKHLSKIYISKSAKLIVFLTGYLVTLYAIGSSLPPLIF